MPRGARSSTHREQQESRASKSVHATSSTYKRFGEQTRRVSRRSGSRRFRVGLDFREPLSSIQARALPPDTTRRVERDSLLSSVIEHILA